MRLKQKKIKYYKLKSRDGYFGYEFTPTGAFRRIVSKNVWINDPRRAGRAWRFEHIYKPLMKQRHFMLSRGETA